MVNCGQSRPLAAQSVFGTPAENPATLFNSASPHRQNSVISRGMAKPSKSLFVCQSCGAASLRWAGKCVACSEWNTIVEETDAGPPPGSGVTQKTKGRSVKLETLKGSTEAPPRFSTGIVELDRVTGGGIVPGSAILIGGEPGIGKSTLLLQLTANLANAGRRALYFSGEEAVAQVRMRAERLGLSNAPVGLACETNLSNILATLSEGRPPDLVVIDSIQTLWADTLDAAPGTVSPHVVENDSGSPTSIVAITTTAFSSWSAPAHPRS